ncbi:MAG: DUF4956 domain-containing protein [Acidimicrobiia bacterium]|nr:DUF4956 domain-containing protein [Acidimicrobiia bacterium]
MSRSLVLALDLAAILVLTFALYFPRHRRKGMVAAYLGTNIGVVAVADALSSSTVSAGLGLGLFGILSIIRLRSDELDQQEIAYYFASLALGLLAGISVAPAWTTAALMGAILLALYVGDHPKLFGRYRTQTLTLDAAYTDEAEVTGVLERLLGGTVHQLTVRKVDLVNASTVVDVTYELPVLAEERTTSALTSLERS